MTEILYGGTPQNIVEKLQTYTLESFSEIIDSPTWLDKEAREKYKGCSEIIGNFVECSNAFKIITDDKVFIKRLKQLFNENAWKKGE